MPAAHGRIFRLHTTESTNPAGDDLSVWSADALLMGPGGGLQINGLDYDGRAQFLHH